MNLILTMAGLYARFTNEGYKIPKYFLPWKDTYILNEIIRSLNKEKIFDNIFLIANKRDEIFSSHIKEMLRLYEQDEKNLFYIDDTSGQAETAFIAINEIQDKIGPLREPIIFHNIDTLLYDRKFCDVKNLLNDYDGYIDIFYSNNHEYSYVRTENNLVTAIAEKILISDKATSGLYGFANADIFLQFYSLDDKYISNVYKKMILQNKKITIGHIYNENNTIVLGTPNEYFSAISKL